MIASSLSDVKRELTPIHGMAANSTGADVGFSEDDTTRCVYICSHEGSASS